MAVTANKRAEQPSSAFAPLRFLREVYEELRKVVWPTAGELYRYTLVVLFTVVLLGAFIGGTDYLLSEIAKRTIYNGAGQ
jgi:preprotein translocase subunit SecE